MSMKEVCTLESDSCDGFCGHCAGDCWCDDWCVDLGDCCHDAVRLCSGMLSFLICIILFK